MLPPPPPLPPSKAAQFRCFFCQRRLRRGFFRRKLWVGSHVMAQPISRKVTRTSKVVLAPGAVMSRTPRPAPVAPLR